MDDGLLIFGGIAILVPVSMVLFYPLWHENWQGDWERFKRFWDRLRKPRA